MVYDAFGKLIADYAGSGGSTLERENICRGGQLLAVYETGLSCFKSISQFVSDFYNGALGRAPGSGDPDWVTTLTQAQSQGRNRLTVAAQNLGTSLFTSTEYANRNRTNSQFVTDLLAGYLGRGPDSGGYDYWMAALNNGSTRDQVRFGFAYSQEFQNNLAALCVTTSSTSANIKYVLSDVQGITRAVMNNNGSSSVVVARHDYLPFGEDLWAGIGLRSSSQTYGATDAIRHQYGLTERDEATGLDHTWFRKYENLSGRWTSPDPLNGGIASPQSFNHYVYSENDPVNFIDPNGLCTFNINISGVTGQALTDLQNELTRIFASGGQSVVFGHPDQANGGSMNLSVVTQYTGATLDLITNQNYNPNTIPGATVPGGSNSFVNSAVIGRLDPSRTTSIMQVISSGTAYGRVGAHEVIQHGFLGQPKETTSGDITQSGTSSVTLFNPQTDRFNMAASTAEALNKLCPPAAPINPGVHELIHGGGPGGHESGGNPRYGTGNDPFDVFRWLDLYYDMLRREWESRQPS